MKEGKIYWVRRQFSFFTVRHDRNNTEHRGIRWKRYFIAQAQHSTTLLSSVLKLQASLLRKSNLEIFQFCKLGQLMFYTEHICLYLLSGSVYLIYLVYSLVSKNIDSKSSINHNKYLAVCQHNLSGNNIQQDISIKVR